MKQELFYIRNEGYLGNALIWWGIHSKGYTCDIRKAGKYTKEEAERRCTRDEDTAYSCDYIDNLLEAQKLIIDCQYVSDSKRLFKRQIEQNA
jgi:hypothetical protein